MRTTNWDLYYSRPFKATIFTRRITGSYLVGLIRRYFKDTKSLELAEFGGANSCFFNLIDIKIKPHKYWVVDNNKFGLDIFKKRIGKRQDVFLLNSDVRKFYTEKRFDLIFSVGLIEHFNREDMKIVIERHFKSLKTGGIVILFFPTPTLLYRLTRFLAEITGVWAFHDESPLKIKDVVMIAGNYGKVLFSKINWWIFLTQGMVVVKKN